MGYTALYRKYRPLTFEGVIGQDHIVRTLKNQLATGRVSHAYLFCGTRGTGKTSTAKIFARAINCLEPQQGEPCNQCALCQTILQGRSMNVIEIDAASNNGVDNIREIREEVKYPPTEGYYKVYIIDEVHMLSGGAFNALLKTLEEPPAHVIFILATTDPQKVPATILSRCQRFDFRRITVEDIAVTLEGYLAQEGLSANHDALRYLARLADGSMRDSLSILDQCLSFYSGEEITLDKVLDVVGSVDNQVFFDMTDALWQRDAKRLMDEIETMVMSGRDIGQFVTEWMNHLRNLLLLVTVGNGEGILDLSGENIEMLQTQGQQIQSETLVYYIKSLSALQADLKYAANERILLEVAMLKLCSESVEASFDGVAARLSQLEKKVETGVVQRIVPTTEPTAPAKPMPQKRPPALPEDCKKAVAVWKDVVENMDTVLKAKMEAVQLGYQEDEYLYLVSPYPAHIDLIANHMDAIQKALAEHLGKEFILKNISKEEYDVWYQGEYGKVEQKDAEFESLLRGYFPEADIVE